MIVNLGLETGRLNADTKKAARHFNTLDRRASKSLNNIKKRLTGITGALSKFGGIASLVSIGGLAVLTKKAIDSADEIHKMSLRLGESSEALSEYRFIADLAGVTFGQLSKGFQQMADKVSDAALGTGEAAASLRELGLDAKVLNTLSVTEQFEDIADAMQGVELSADKVRIAMDLFGGRNVALIQAMEGGSAAIRELRMEARELGFSLSDEEVLGAARAKDNLVRLQAVAKALSRTFGTSLQGPIADVAEALTKAAVASGGFQSEIRTAIKAALTGLSALIGAVDSTFDFFKKNPNLFEAGIVGLLIYGKKGLAAILAAQAAVNLTASAVEKLHRVTLATGGALTVSVEDLVNAEKRLAFLRREYNDEVEKGFDGTRAGLRDLATGTQKQIEQQELRVQGLRDLLAQGEKLTGTFKTDTGLLAKIGMILDESINKMDSLTNSAERAAAARAKALAEGAGGVVPEQVDTQLGPEVIDTSAQDDATKARNQARLDSLTLSLMTEEQRLFQSHENRELIINTAFENELINKETQRELLLQLAQDFETKQTEILKRNLTDRERFEALSNTNKIRETLASGTQITQGLATSSKKIFKLNQAFALGNAAVALPDAVLQSFERGGGYPWGLVPAGLMLATGTAQINAIRSARIGGGSVAPSLAGSGGGSTTVGILPAGSPAPGQIGLDQQQAQQAAAITVIVQGNVFANDDFRAAMVEALEQAQSNDEIRIVVNG